MKRAPDSGTAILPILEAPDPLLRRMRPRGSKGKSSATDRAISYAHSTIRGSARVSLQAAFERTPDQRSTATSSSVTRLIIVHARSTPMRSSFTCNHPRANAVEGSLLGFGAAAARRVLPAMRFRCATWFGSPRAPHDERKMTVADRRQRKTEKKQKT
jgi:hypothetical protein